MTPQVLTRGGTAAHTHWYRCAPHATGTVPGAILDQDYASGGLRFRISSQEAGADMSVKGGRRGPRMCAPGAVGRCGADSAPTAVPTRGCHGYIPEDYISALYAYPLRIRAGDAYPKCIMRKGGEDISILSDRNCKMISDPNPRYERQDTGIYTVMRLPAPGEFWFSTVDLSFRVPTIAELMSEHLGATSGDPARPRWNR